MKKMYRIVGISWIAQQEEIITVDAHGKLEVYQYRKGKIVYNGEAGLDCTYISLHPDSDYMFCSSRMCVKAFKINRHIPFQEYSKHTDPIIGLHIDERFPADRRLISGT
jgi:hypothetical protein